MFLCKNNASANSGASGDLRGVPMAGAEWRNDLLGLFIATSILLYLNVSEVLRIQLSDLGAK